jgi:hypothetical protein
MEKTIKIFKQLSEKGYRAALSHTIEGLDELPINHPIKTAEMALVCEWLRVKYGIWVYLEIEDDMSTFTWNCVYKIKNAICKGYDEKFYNSPQEAYSPAFDYVLNNLI